VWQGSWRGKYPKKRGVNTILVDPLNCSAQESRHFDTWGDSNAAIQLRNYLQQVNRENIIVGVTADEPVRYLADAQSTLSDIGVDVADVQRRGSFAFVEQQGFPTKTVFRKALTEAESNANPAHINATITGSIGCELRGRTFVGLFHNDDDDDKNNKCKNAVYTHC